jgi:hypothetical protein
MTVSVNPRVPGLGHISIDPPDVIPMNDALDIAFEKLGIETLGGASGHGWSRYRDLQKCPYKFYLKHVAKRPKDNSPAPGALETGSAFHALMAVYYQRQIDFDAGKEEPVAEAGVLCDELIVAGGNPNYINEAWRIFEAYANFYEARHDYLIPLAVERWTQDVNGPDTCRYDLIAKVEDTTAPVLPGIWIVEHKSSSRLDRAVTEGWHLDGEIIGELMIYKRARLNRVYGKLAGIIVNVITKTKVPNFHREIVSPPAAQMRRQVKDLRVWRATEAVYASTNTWPRALASCWDRYGPCEFFEECRNV